MTALVKLVWYLKYRYTYDSFSEAGMLLKYRYTYDSFSEAGMVLKYRYTYDSLVKLVWD